MLIPDDDEIKREGVIECLQATYDYFTKVYPELTKKLGINFQQDQLFTMYYLADSDEEFIRNMAAHWNVDIEDEVTEDELKTILKILDVEEEDDNDSEAENA